MESFRHVQGVAAPLMIANIDTGAMITSEAIRDYPKEKLGTQLFANWRFDRDGNEKPDFPLNQPRYKDCRILVAGPNFGCGSSREMAVWGLMGYGIRCVVASSFAEIFFNNCFQNGLLPVALDEALVESIADTLRKAERPEMTADLENNRLVLPDGRTIPFSLSGDRRAALLEGLDEFGVLLRMRGEIDAFQKADAVERPWIYAHRKEIKEAIGGAH